MITIHSNFDTSNQATSALSHLKNTTIKIKGANISTSKETTSINSTNYNLIGIGVLNNTASTVSNINNSQAGIPINAILTKEYDFSPTHLTINAPKENLEKIVSILKSYGMNEYSISSSEQPLEKN